MIGSLMNHLYTDSNRSNIHIFEDRVQCRAFLMLMANSLNCLTDKDGVSDWQIVFIGVVRKAWVGIDRGEFSVMYKARRYLFPMDDPCFLPALASWLHGHTDTLHEIVVDESVCAKGICGDITAPW